MSETDDYWDDSDVKEKALRFEDDDRSSQQFRKLGAEVRAGLDNTSSLGKDLNFNAPRQSMLPLDIILSNISLEMILLAQSGQFPRSEKMSPTNESEQMLSITLKRIVVGRPYSFHYYKSLKSKTHLLDGAIAIGDGNAILAVVLYLVQTLKKKLIYQLFSSRPAAVNHYVNYLLTRLKTHELTDLLTMLGRSGEAAVRLFIFLLNIYTFKKMKQYQMIMQTSTSSPDFMLTKVKNLFSNHFSQPAVEPFHTKILANYIKLIEWQKCMSVPELYNKSAIQSLGYCCAHHWTDGAGKVGSPQSFCQQQQISNQQYDWTAVTVKAMLKNWESIETMFTKKNFLGRSTMACSISLPKVIGRLHELGANSILLGVYLDHISSVEQRLELAKKFKAHRTVLNCFISQKDRQALTQYKMTLHPQSEEYFLAENALRASTVQWKN